MSEERPGRRRPRSPGSDDGSVDAGVGAGTDREGERADDVGASVGAGSTVAGTEPPDPVQFDPRPSRTGTAVASLAGSVAVVTQAAGGPAAVVGGAGLLLLVVGLRRGARRAVTLGAVGLFVGVLVAGVVGAAVEPLLVSAAASVVTWDAASQALDVGEQVGRAADTARAELVHAAGSAVVAAAAVTVAYVAFLTVDGGSVLSLLLLLVGGLLLASVLRG